MSAIESHKWKASFKLVPELMIRQAKNWSNVTIIQTSNGSNLTATGLEVTVDALSDEDAHKRALEIANRCTNYLSYLKKGNVQVVLNNMTNLDNPTSATVGIGLKVIWGFDKSIDVDLSENTIASAINGSEEKLSRQLLHYHRATQSDDIAIQAEELFQILEDEYGRNNSTIMEQKNLRDVLLHPVLDNPNLITWLKSKIRKDHISSVEDIAKLKLELENLKAKVEETMWLKIH